MGETRKCIHFGRKTSWKVTTWKTTKVMDRYNQDSEIGCEKERWSGLRSCPMAGFDISGVELSGSAASQCHCYLENKQT
jgi:hypothetical protein